MAGESVLRDEYAFFLMSPAAETVRKTLEALAVDVSAVLTVIQSDDGRRTYREQLTGVEGA
jgi:6-phosphogluconate dehydrogenase (decarboxylating)